MTVRRRAVFYVSGFDPRGARHYHGLFRDECRRQAQLGGWAPEVGPRQSLGSGNAAWELRGQEAPGKETRVHYEFLQWDDIVRQHWPRTVPALWRQVLTTTLRNLGEGSLLRMARLSWPPALALTLPFVLLALVLVGTPLLGMVIWNAVAATGAGWPVSALATGAGVAALLAGAHYLEQSLGMYWLTRGYAYLWREAQRTSRQLDERIDRHAQVVRGHIESGEFDEVLVVGHSSGAIMAPAVLRRALAGGPQGEQSATRVALLTLGQCIPMMGTLSGARHLREELTALAQMPIAWIDFSAPPDASCFALCDPFQACGVSPPPPGGLRLKLLNPRFATLFPPKRYAALKRDKLRTHFQYLSASELPGDYDYFRICAGSRTLEERYAHLPSVKAYSQLRWLRGLSTPRGT